MSIHINELLKNRADHIKAPLRCHSFEGLQSTQDESFQITDLGCPGGAESSSLYCYYGAQLIFLDIRKQTIETIESNVSVFCRWSTLVVAFLMSIAGPCDVMDGLKPETVRMNVRNELVTSAKLMVVFSTIPNKA